MLLLQQYRTVQHGRLAWRLGSKIHRCSLFALSTTTDNLTQDIISPTPYFPNAAVYTSYFGAIQTCQTTVLHHNRNIEPWDYCTGNPRFPISKILSARTFFEGGRIVRVKTFSQFGYGTSIWSGLPLPLVQTLLCHFLLGSGPLAGSSLWDNSGTIQ